MLSTTNVPLTAMGEFTVHLRSQSRGPRRPLAFVFAGLAVALLLTACTDSDSRVIEKAVSFELPTGFSKSSATVPSPWNAEFDSPKDSPTDTVRVSSDLGLSSAADTTLAAMRGNSLLTSGFGDDFTPVETKQITVKNADRALQYSFTTKSSDDRDLRGYWILFSNRETGKTACVEVVGSTITQDQVGALRESIRFTPKDQ